MILLNEEENVFYLFVSRRSDEWEINIRRALCRILGRGRRLAARNTSGKKPGTCNTQGFQEVTAG